eukprot:363878-Chlamydomonas_euryale.AAC.12
MHTRVRACAQASSARKFKPDVVRPHLCSVCIISHKCHTNPLLVSKPRLVAPANALPAKSGVTIKLCSNARPTHPQRNHQPTCQPPGTSRLPPDNHPCRLEPVDFDLTATLAASSHLTPT